MSRARRDDPGMAASLELAALTAARPRRGAGARRRGRRDLGRLDGAVRPRPQPARVRPDRRRRRGRGTAAIEAERIFRSMGARGPAADAAEIVEAISTARAADAPDPVARAVPARPRRRARPDDGVAVEEGPRPAEDPRRAARPGDDPRHVLRAALARRRPGAARQPAVGRAGDGPVRPRPGQALPGRVLRAGRQGPIALDLDHVELDVEAFLVAAAAAARLARAGDAADRARAARGGRGAVRRRLPRGGPVRGLGRRRSARRPRRPTSRSPGRWPRPPRRTATPTARPATTSGSSSATRTTRAPTWGWSRAAGRGRPPRRGPPALRVLRGEDGGDRGRGGTVPGVDGEWRRGRAGSPGSFAAAPG